MTSYLLSYCTDAFDELFSDFVHRFETFFAFGGESIIFSGGSLLRFDSDIF